MITAEGIETQAELNALRTLGIHYGQGYYIAHPGPSDGAGTRAASRHPSRPALTVYA